MTDQEKTMAGICCYCGAKIKPWTRDEIQEVKDDLGLGEDDDFGDICWKCWETNYPGAHPNHNFIN